MAATPNSLFIVPAKVRRGPNCPMPAHLLGAVVPCFVAATDHLSAVKLAVGKLQADGYVFEDLVGGQVQQLDPSGWSRYVEATWPDVQSRLPSQPEVFRLLEAGGLFFGPFAAWDREAAMADSSEPRSVEQSPFDHIVDDGPARHACADWAVGEIGGGRSTEDVAADLVANGWSSDDAEHICEQARRATRHLRGGTSREEVARAFGVGDPNVMRNATPFAKPNLFGALGQFIRAFFRFRSLKNVGKRK